MAQSGLAAAGGSYQRQLTSLFKAQIDIVKDFLGRVVGIGDIFKFDDPLNIRKFFCVRRIHFRRFVHNLHKPFEAADAVLKLLHEADQGVYRIDEQVHGDDEGGIIAEGYSACI